MKIGFEKSIEVRGYRITLFKEVEADEENLEAQIKSLEESFHGFCERKLPKIREVLQEAE